MDLTDSGPPFSAAGDFDGDRLTVVVTGEVDMSTADAMFQAATRDGARALTLDLCGVSFFDSAAVHAVIRLHQHYPGALTVVPSEQVMRVLQITGLADQSWVAKD